MKRLFSVIILVLTIIFCNSLTVAAATNPYKDVTTKKVDKGSYDAIVYVKKYNGFRGVVTSTKFYPNRYMTRRELVMILHNLYGNAVVVTIDDVRYANKIVTSAYVCQRMVAVSKKIGSPIKWNGNSKKMRRKDVARYIKIFGTFRKALTPKRR